jgi:hypothetical protein
MGMTHLRIMHAVVNFKCSAFHTVRTFISYMTNLLLNFTRSEDATVTVYVHLEVSSFMIHNNVLRVCVVNYAVCFHSRNSGRVEYTFILPWAQRYQSLDENLKFLYRTNYYKIHWLHATNADFITTGFLYMFRASRAHHQEYKTLTLQPPVQVVMVAGGSSLRHIPVTCNSSCRVSVLYSWWWARDARNM